MKKILIVNGPNLNLLGVREPSIYGHDSFESYMPQLRADFPDVKIKYYQSNVEGELINKLQEVGFEYRHKSMISAACLGVICGFGLAGYKMAIEGLLGQAPATDEKTAE